MKGIENINENTFIDYIESETTLEEYCKVNNFDIDEVKLYAKNILKKNNNILYRQYSFIVRSYAMGVIETYKYYNEIIKEYIASDMTLKSLLDIKGVEYTKIVAYAGSYLPILDMDLYNKYRDKAKYIMKTHNSLTQNTEYEDIIKEYIKGNFTLKDICKRHNIKTELLYSYLYNYIKKNDVELYEMYISKKGIWD